MLKVTPKVLAILPAFIPSTMICVMKPFLQLHRDGHIIAKIKLESQVRRKNLDWADLVVFSRNTEPRYSYVIDYLQESKIPFIYEIDDNFFELPLDTEEGRYHRQPDRLAMLSNYMQMANLIRVYSNPLLKKAKTLNHRVEKVFGPIDRSLISNTKIKTNSKIKLVYVTSRIQDEISVIFSEGLGRVLKDYAERVECHFWGAIPSEVKHYPGIYFHKPIRNYNRFLKSFSKSGYDIGLAPLPDDLFHRSKTNNKFREYGACNIAGIYSDMEVYSSSVKHEETGLLVQNNPEAWYSAIVQLIEDRTLREKIKKQARAFVFDNYYQEKFEKIWLDHLHRVISEGITSPVKISPNNPITSNQLFFTNKFKKVLKIFRSLGWRGGFTSIRWYFFGIWMSFKLPIQLHIITVTNLFNQKRKIMSKIF